MVATIVIVLSFHSFAYAFRLVSFFHSVTLFDFIPLFHLWIDMPNRSEGASMDEFTEELREQQGKTVAVATRSVQVLRTMRRHKYSLGSFSPSTAALRYRSSFSLAAGDVIMGSPGK